MASELDSLSDGRRGKTRCVAEERRGGALLGRLTAAFVRSFFDGLFSSFLFAVDGQLGNRIFILRSVCQCSFLSILLSSVLLPISRISTLFCYLVIL